MGLEAYFDESGTHAGSPIMLMAGYVSTEEKWVEFRDKWGILLKHCGMKRLHMVELLKPEASLESVEIAKWAVEIIKKSIEIGVCFSMLESDFQDLTTLKLRKELGDAYSFITQMTLGCWESVKN